MRKVLTWTFLLTGLAATGAAVWVETVPVAPPAAGAAALAGWAGVVTCLGFQMFGAAWIGFGAGCLPPARGKAELGLLAAYAAAAGILYGSLLNLWFWPFGAGTATAFSIVPGAGLVHNLHSFFFFDLTTSLGFDIPRACTNALLVLVLGRPVLGALRRASRRAAFDVPVVHEGPVESPAG